VTYSVAKGRAGAENNTQSLIVITSAIHILRKESSRKEEMTENMATSSDDGCLEDSRKEEIAFTPNDSAPSRKVS
jgi:hypothetical protein